MFNLGLDRLTPRILTQLAHQDNVELNLSAEAKERVQSFRTVVDNAVDSGKTFYGINTGFGLLSDIGIEPSQIKQLQLNLVRSHACGVGEAVPAEVARALLIVKAHQFCLGFSGIRLEIIEQLLTFLKHDILPVIPAKGSVGASGDLAPMAHLALGLIGEGKVHYKNEYMDAKQALKKAGVEPLTLSYKEGLSLINGTQFMTAIGCLAIERAENLAVTADIAAALSLDALRGTVAAFDPRIHNVREQSGQRTVAENLRHLINAENNEINKSHENCGRVQDPYSFRCVPQVHGASRDAIYYCKDILEKELNSVTDNPLVFLEGDILSGGNFHGQPVALAMDFLKIAVAEFGSISERRIEKLTDPKMSHLPAFIVKDSGLNSGYMIPHVVAAALVSENKVLCHPASVDSIPTSADKEDHVSMGPIAARQALQIIENVENILAIELLAAAQGLDLLEPLKSSVILEKVRKEIRSISQFMDKDRSLHEDIVAIRHKVTKGDFISCTNQDTVIIH